MVSRAVGSGSRQIFVRQRNLPSGSRLLLLHPHNLIGLAPH